MKRKFKAFTLAEVLITLVIIGVVAALTIPVVMSQYRKHITASRLKIAYSTLSRAIQAAEKDHGAVSSWFSEEDFALNLNTDQMLLKKSDFLDTYIAPYLNVSSNETKTLREFGYKKGFLLPNGTAYFSPDEVARGIMLNNGMFINSVLARVKSRDGTQLWVTGVTLEIDIDGPSHGANTFGKDIFCFSIMFSPYQETARFIPSQIYHITYNIKGNTLSSTGIEPRSREELLQNCSDGTSFKTQYCCALIMKDNWQIKDDYPWL